MTSLKYISKQVHDDLNKFLIQLTKEIKKQSLVTLYIEQVMIDDHLIKTFKEANLSHRDSLTYLLGELEGFSFSDFYLEISQAISGNYLVRYTGDNLETPGEWISENIVPLTPDNFIVILILLLSMCQGSIELRGYVDDELIKSHQKATR